MERIDEGRGCRLRSHFAQQWTLGKMIQKAIVPFTENDAASQGLYPGDEMRSGIETAGGVSTHRRWLRWPVRGMVAHH